MQLGELEVVWPLHRWHYLSPALADEGLVMHTDPVSADDPTTASVDEATHGRDLAARALLADLECSRVRVSELLGVSRRTLGRMADLDFTTAIRDPQALDAARTCLEETASRGSTPAEREAAIAWMLEAARSEHHFAKPAEAARPPRSRVARRTRRVVARRPHRTSAPRNGTRRPPGDSAATPTPVPPDPAPAAALIPPEILPEPPALMPLDALRCQQLRILRRSALIDYVLTAERQRGQTLTMGDALAELLADISDAARTIGTLLQAGGAATTLTTPGGGGG